MQPQLFPGPDCQSFALQDGALLYYPDWLSDRQAWLYFRQLEKHCAWRQSTIRIAGRPVKIPRLNAWYGDPGANYQYSGRAFQPLPWIRALNGLRQRLRQQLGQAHALGQTLSGKLTSVEMNSALVNYYRDGQDSVAWHADDEPELGPGPVIASISLGERRRFLLKRRDGTDKLTLDLAHGSLLLMLPPLQGFWLHSLPKSKRVHSARINVTFRRVIVQ